MPRICVASVVLWKMMSKLEKFNVTIEIIFIIPIVQFLMLCFETGHSVKNNADAIIFHTVICAENVTNKP